MGHNTAQDHWENSKTENKDQIPAHLNDSRPSVPPASRDKDFIQHPEYRRLPSMSNFRGCPEADIDPKMRDMISRHDTLYHTLSPTDRQLFLEQLSQNVAQTEQSLSPRGQQYGTPITISPQGPWGTRVSEKV